MEPNLENALANMEEWLKVQQVLIDSGFLPRSTEDILKECMKSVRILIDYVKDTEDLKKI